MAQTPVDEKWQDLDEEVQQAQKMLDAMEQQNVRPEHTTKARNKRRRVEPTVKWIERDAFGYRIQDYSKPLRRESVTTMSLVPEMQSTASADKSRFDPFNKGPSNEEMLDVLRQEMEELISGAVLDGPEVPTIPSIASVDWAIRKSKSLERWKELRPDLIQYMLKAENTVQTMCSHCRNKTAVLRCRDCLPKQYYCEDCDLSLHAVFVLHNRDSMVDGFFRPIPPTTVIKCASDGKLVYEEKDCELPVPVPERICTCAAAATASVGKRVILITVNGRYSVCLPVLNCTLCGNSWSPNSSDLIQNGYWPASVSYETIYSMDLFSMFEDTKVIAPAMSLQAFTRTLEQRTSHFGRMGKICDNTFQRSYLEWNYCRFEMDQLCHIQHFKCPACMPNMLAVSADGNRKHYRFKKGTDDKGFYDGFLLAKDEEVSSFVDYIHKTTKHVSGKGKCGTSQWTAAKESSKKSTSKIDEEGLEVAVCRHGIILKALNMYRGEIFAYPLFLQKEIAVNKVKFFCSDVVCRYWPYLQKVVNACPELSHLQDMKPFLSIMHAKAHASKCEVKWGGRNQQGAGTTLGEEVEQVNSFLSKTAICLKQMSKSVRTDMLTIQVIGWNGRKRDTMHCALSQRYRKTVTRAKEQSETIERLQEEFGIGKDTLETWTLDVQEWANTVFLSSFNLCGSEASGAETALGPDGLQQKIEGLFLSIKQRKQQLYSQTDRSKRRHHLRRKMQEDKKKLAAAVEEYNNLVLDDQKICTVDTILSSESHTWPWELHGRGSSVDLFSKKRVFDAVMMLRRLQEEESILLTEIKQHWESLRANSQALKQLATQLCQDLSGQSDDLGEMNAKRGLLCFVRKSQSYLNNHLQIVREKYLSGVNQEVSSFEDDLDDLSFDSSHYSDTDEEEEEVED